MRFFTARPVGKLH